MNEGGDEKTAREKRKNINAIAITGAQRTEKT